MKKSRLFRGLASITAGLMCILIAAISIVNTNASFINTRLGTTNVVYEETGSGDVNTTYYSSDYDSIEEVVAAKEALAEQIASEGTVLLKNDNSALPLNKSSEQVTLWGLNSINPTLGGRIGSTAIANQEAGQSYYTLQDALTEKGFTINQDMLDLYNSEDAQAYARGDMGHSITPSFGAIDENVATYQVGEAPKSIYTDSVLSSADNTVALVVISRDSSEAADYYPDQTSADESDSFTCPLALSQNEQDMIALAEQHSTKVVVLLNTSSTIEIDSLKQDSNIDSIVWCGDPGTIGFLGTVDVLDGDANPSGHLGDTYAVANENAPSAVNFGVYTYTNYSGSGASDAMDENNKSDWYVVETEGIYDGYKYYETRYADQITGSGNATSSEGSTTGSSWDWANEVSYPFGYGLSYTTFSETLDAIDVQVGGDSKATVTVTNTGSKAGKHVVQLYAQAPYTKGGVEKSAIQLVAYEKTDELKPGESVTIEIPFDMEYVSSYDKTATKADGTTGAWTLDAGDYYFSIGNGAHEALNNILATTAGEGSLEKTSSAETINAANALVWTNEATDVETYSANVQNELQSMDLNTYIDGKVTYMSRSDWTKGWDVVTDVTPTDEMMTGLNNDNYEITANGDGVTWGADNGLTILDMMVDNGDGTYSALDIDDPKWDELCDQITLDEAIQFIEKGGDDIEDIASVMLMRTYANDGPVGFASDQVASYAVRWQKSNENEEGYTTEDDTDADYYMSDMPTEPVVAATFNKELAEQEGDLLAEDAIYANESLIIAPGANLHRSPYCARNHEYYSEDSMLTAYMSSSFCQGAEAKGLIAEVKHFAFNHQESNRSGVSTFIDEQAARENELRCFQMAMENNYCSSIMTAFNRAGTVYVGGYSPLLVNISRDEWGYNGSMTTDMINGADYMNWRDIVIGGGGTALTTSAYETANIGTMANSKSAIEKDTEFQKMMKDGIKYWLYCLVTSNSMNGLSATTEIHRVLTWYQWAIYIATVVMAILTVLFGFLSYKRYKKEVA